MSKKKKKKWLGMVALDEHHIFYTKVSWNQPIPSRLRSYWYCVVEVPKGTTHHKIHEKVRYVPVPRNEAILEILEQLIMLDTYGAIRPDDPIEKRLNVLAGLCDCIAQPTADALRKQLEAISGLDNPP